VKVSGEWGVGRDKRLIWAIKQKIIAHLRSAPDLVLFKQLTYSSSGAN
jgi:hypothetical protein